MANEFRVCDDCQATNIKTLLPRLKEADPDAKVEVGCQSYCARTQKIVCFRKQPPAVGAD